VGGWYLSILAGGWYLYIIAGGSHLFKETGGLFLTIAGGWYPSIVADGWANGWYRFRAASVSHLSKETGGLYLTIAGGWYPSTGGWGYWLVSLYSSLWGAHTKHLLDKTSPLQNVYTHNVSLTKRLLNETSLVTKCLRNKTSP
jgi:hypothetical protein